MSEEILINVTPRETRVAVVEGGVLQELYVERANRRGLVGNIYKGRVVRVLPGMQAAFVDIGLERAAFLHASDAQSVWDGNGADEVDPSVALREYTITELLHEGEELLVQVIKDPLGSKGARLTTRLTVPSRFLVFGTAMNSIGVSLRIEDEQERTRLRDIVRAHRMDSGTGGFIVRTAAEFVREEDLKADIVFLNKLWESIHKNAREAQARTCVYEDLPLVLRTMRDLIGLSVEKVRIDSQEACQQVRRFAEQFLADMVERIECYEGERPIFELFGVEDEIAKAMERKVGLKSGGHLVIDQTEAMTTVDVNTGGFVGHRNLEETIFKTNLEAAQAIVRQLRLRNLGGIIIIDFIDMTDPEHRRQVLRALEKALARDHARTYLTGVSELGLVQMTRKRTRESLEHILCEPCPTCGGRGSVKTAETVCYEIFRELLRQARQFDAEQFLVLASQPVVDRLLDEESASVAEVELSMGRPVRFQVETLYAQEQFDVVPC